MNPNQGYYGRYQQKPQQGFNIFGWGGHNNSNQGHNYPQQQQGQHYTSGNGYGGYQQQSYQQQHQPTDETYGDPPPMYPADENPSTNADLVSRPPGAPPGTHGTEDFSRPLGPPPAHVK